VNIAVNTTQTWKKCDEKALDLLFYFIVNFVLLFIRSASVSASAISCFCFCWSDWIWYPCSFVLLLLLLLILLLFCLSWLCLVNFVTFRNQDHLPDQGQFSNSRKHCKQFTYYLVRLSFIIFKYNPNDRQLRLFSPRKCKQGKEKLCNWAKKF
jgi:protein-S-isoprenylcysteine O-methyltransferase Ste14